MKVPGITDNAGLLRAHARFNIDPRIWIHHLLNLEVSVPLSLVVAPVLVWLAWRAFSGKESKQRQGIVYAVTVFLVSALALMANIIDTSWRFWLLALPVYVLLVCHAAAGLIDLWRSSARKRWRGLPARPVLVIGVLGWTLMVFLVSAAALGSAKYAEILAKGYGRPCPSGSTCDPAIERGYAILRPAVKPEDRVISSNPNVSYYYLHRLDGFLRERKFIDGFGVFDFEVDDFYAVQMVDTLEEFRQLKDSPQRVWILTDQKIRRFSSVEMKYALAKEFPVHLRSGALTVHVNRLPE